MKRKILFAILFVFFALNFLHAQTSGFEIVYNADLNNASDPLWLQKISTDWHATGVNLRIRWRNILNIFPHSNIIDGNCNWTNLDNALAAIAGNNLDIYIRINMCDTRTSWQSSLQNAYNDSMMCKTQADTIYYNAYTDNTTRGPRMFSVLSRGAQKVMEKFYSLVLAHLNTLTSCRDKIKLIVPTFNQDDESDLPGHTKKWINNENKDRMESTGFSLGERKYFKDYLLERYSNTITKLNSVWGTSFSSFDQIQEQMSGWNWYTIGNFGSGYLTVTYPKGKKDWVDFKTEALKRFHNRLASITHGYQWGGKTLKYGIQTAPIYLNGSEDRGYHDPTSIFENADYIIAADGPQMQPNHDWIADVMRSIANYWSFEKGKTGDNKIKFATELSWMYYNCLFGVRDSMINPLSDDAEKKNRCQAVVNALNTYYPEQINSFYTHGASAIFLSHWGTDEFQWIADLVKTPIHSTGKWSSETSDPDERQRYLTFRTALSNVKGDAIQTINNYLVYHISFEQGLYIRPSTGTGLDYYAHNEGDGSEVTGTVPLYTYPLKKFCSGLSNYIVNLAYNGTGDFLTNFMVRNDSTFFRRYYTANNNSSGIYLTGTSVFIPDDVYEIFMQKSYKNKFMYTTRYESSPALKEYFTPGLYNEYNVKRVPIRLQWQIRNDLQGIFPHCSLPNPTQTTYPWYQNDLSKDIIYWAANHAVQQYRDFSIYNSAGSPQYNYDKNITYFWQSSSSLQYDYPNGHYQRNSSVAYKTMLEWAIAHDPTNGLLKTSSVTDINYSRLTNYQYWPIIITPGALSKELKEEKVPYTFDLSQNYPNPFNPTTTIKFSLPSRDFVNLKIYDILGREICTLINEIKDSGIYSVSFNGSGLSSGVYIYTLSSSNQHISKKLLLLK